MLWYCIHTGSQNVNILLNKYKYSGNTTNTKIIRRLHVIANLTPLTPLNHRQGMIADWLQLLSTFRACFSDSVVMLRRDVFILLDKTATAANVTFEDIICSLKNVVNHNMCYCTIPHIAKCCNNIILWVKYCDKVVLWCVWGFLCLQHCPVLAFLCWCHQPITTLLYVN